MCSRPDAGRFLDLFCIVSWQPHHGCTLNLQGAMADGQYRESTAYVDTRT